MVGPGRVERPTSRLSGVRSNHLSYEPSGSPVAGCEANPPVTRRGCFVEAAAVKVNGLAQHQIVAVNQRASPLKSKYLLDILTFAAKDALGIGA